MLEYIKRDKMEYYRDLEEEFKGCMFIITDINNNIEHLMGKLYCVSHSSDSYKEISDVYCDLWKQGHKVSLLGLYKDAWAPGLQCVIRE